MYENFTDRSRKVMDLAHEAALRLKHEYIGTEHILLGLVKEGTGPAVAKFKNLNVKLIKIRFEIEKLIRSGPTKVTQKKLPHTSRAQKVLEYATQEAGEQQHDFVYTDDIVIGLLREKDGLAANVLNKILNLEIEDIHAQATTFKKRRRLNIVPSFSYFTNLVPGIELSSQTRTLGVRNAKLAFVAGGRLAG